MDLGGNEQGRENVEWNVEYSEICRCITTMATKVSHKEESPLIFSCSESRQA